MNSNKNRSFVSRSVSEQDASVLAVFPILINVIAVAILAGVYYYITANDLYPDYQTYIYWTVNVLISYNILVASTRSVWAPLLSVIGGVFGIFALGSPHAIAFLSSAECWQLAVLGVIGLIITFTLRL